MKELQEAWQDVVDAYAKVRQAQCVELLASSTFTAARQAVDVSIDRFKQAGAYRLLHTHLMRQSFRHVGDNDPTIDT